MFSKQEIMALIRAAKENPFTRLNFEKRFEEAEKSRQQTRDSKLHQVDLAFRKAFTELIKGGESTIFLDFAKDSSPSAVSLVVEQFLSPIIFIFLLSLINCLGNSSCPCRPQKNIFAAKRIEIRCHKI